MILPNSNISTSTSGLLSSSDFGIGDAGIILEILRTKIYTNPILAICREITCNARDAHREIGISDRPIEVYLPNTWSPNLIIKDFGPGIDPSRMEDIFIKFGNSTKRNNNVQLGGFGIGSKTPLAYSDTFNITTTVSGTKYKYSAYIDETKVGKMTLLSQEPTTDPNGTSIEIPILRTDYRTFASTVVDVTKHWDVKPKLLGGENIPAWKVYETVYEGNRWTLPKSTKNSNYSYYDSPPSLAIIDGIGYKLDVYSLTNITELQKAVLKTGFHFTFGIGELSLAASRDTIHYDEPTQKLILERIDALTSEVVVLVTNKIQHASTYIEACKAYAGVKETLNNSGLMDRLTGIRWNGHEIHLTIKVNDIGQFATVKSYVIGDGDEVKSSRKDSTLHFLNSKIGLYHHDLISKSVPGYLVKHLLENLEAVQVVKTEDLPTSPEYLEAIERATRNNKPMPTVSYDKDLMQRIGFKSLQAVLDAIPKEKIERVYKPRGKVADGNIMGYNIDLSGGEIISTSFPLAQGGIFVQVDPKTKEYKSNGRILTLSQIRMLKNFLGVASIVGFTEFRMQKLGKEWQPLLDVAQAKLLDKKKADNIVVEEINENRRASHYLFDYHMEDMRGLKNATFRDKLSAGSLLSKYIDESQRVVTLVNKHHDLLPVLTFFGEKIEDEAGSKYSAYIKTAPQCKLAKLLKEAQERYPLIKNLRSVDNSELLSVIEYINLIDAKIEREKTKLACNAMQLTETSWV
jgi:hypothetical protein